MQTGLDFVKSIANNILIRWIDYECPNLSRQSETFLDYRYISKELLTETLSALDTLQCFVAIKNVYVLCRPTPAYLLANPITTL